jgi:hypothetical protein
MHSKAFLKPGRKLAEKLDNGLIAQFGGGAAEESIINAFSVVVSATALAFSFNSTVWGVKLLGGKTLSFVHAETSRLSWKLIPLHGINS